MVKLRNRKSFQENPEKITEDHTFKPSINDNPSFSKEKNFELRIIENLKKKQEKLIKLQAENNEKFTFHPKINPKSEEIIQKTLNNSFSFKGNSKQIEKKENNWTFQPKTLDNPKYPVEGDFIERVEMKNKEKHAKIMIIAEEVFSENVTFKPKINRISAMLTQDDPERKKINSVERLHTNVFSNIFQFFLIFIIFIFLKPNSNKEKKIQVFEEEFNKKHSFKPKINKNSGSFNYSVEKLYDDAENKEKIQRKKQVFIFLK